MTQLGLSILNMTCTSVLHTALTSSIAIRSTVIRNGHVISRYYRHLHSGKPNSPLLSKPQSPTFSSETSGYIPHGKNWSHFTVAENSRLFRLHSYQESENSCIQSVFRTAGVYKEKEGYWYWRIWTDLCRLIALKSISGQFPTGYTSERAIRSLSELEREILPQLGLSYLHIAPNRSPTPFIDPQTLRRRLHLAIKQHGAIIHNCTSVYEKDPVSSAAHHRLIYAASSTFSHYDDRHDIDSPPGYLVINPRSNNEPQGTSLSDATRFGKDSFTPFRPSDSVRREMLQFYAFLRTGGITQNQCQDAGIGLPSPFLYRT